MTTTDLHSCSDPACYSPAPQAALDVCGGAKPSAPRHAASPTGTGPDSCAGGAHPAVLGDGHQAIEDEAGPSGRCRRCGEEIWWPGPGPYDFAHCDEEPPP